MVDLPRHNELPLQFKGQIPIGGCLELRCARCDSVITSLTPEMIDQLADAHEIVDYKCPGCDQPVQLDFQRSP